MKSALYSQKKNGDEKSFRKNILPPTDKTNAQIIQIVETIFSKKSQYFDKTRENPSLDFLGKTQNFSKLRKLRPSSILSHTGGTDLDRSRLFESRFANWK